MNRTYYDIHKIHREDFEIFLNFVNSRSELYCINQEIFKGDLKNIYKQVFCLMTFYSKSNFRENHLKESILNLPIALDLLATNNITPFRLICRNIIEQFNRYLFSKMSESTCSIRNMHAYIKKYYKKYKISKFINLLMNEYKNLCEYVHVTKSNHFLTQFHLQEYYFDTKQQRRKIRSSIKLFNNILQSILIILASVEVNAFLNLNRDDQRLIELSIHENLGDFVILDNYYKQTRSPKS